MKLPDKPIRCIHCCRPTESPEGDHVFPDSWYPDSTPPTVQRWTAPSCPVCNRKFGQLEKDLLVRMVLCLDPKGAPTSGLAEKVFRSLGIDVNGLPEREKEAREKLRSQLKSEFVPYAEVADLPKIPGLGPSIDEEPQHALFLPYAGLAMIAEKIARGCEYRYKNRRRYVEHPYGVRILVKGSGDVPGIFADGEGLDFGPGCRVIRVWEPEIDPEAVCYWVSIWGALHMTVLIDLETNLLVVDKELKKSEGTLPPEDRAMQVPSYLRDFSR